jgi:nitrate reductase assembly molybdenum cofactor insertion protein NarJ
MRPSPEVHDALACLLSYPGAESRAGTPEATPEGTLEKTPEETQGTHYPAAVEVVSLACPETAAPLGRFLEGIAGLEPGELEELYTRTFDNVAERSLEIGWQLFGENYARGILMVRFRALMREHGVREQTELPDHLTHVMPLLGRLPEKVAAAFAHGQVKLAVKPILEGLRTCESPWVGVLEALELVLGMHESQAGVQHETPAEKEALK